MVPQTRLEVGAIHRVQSELRSVAAGIAAAVIREVRGQTLGVELSGDSMGMLFKLAMGYADYAS
jgi:hypothetical protein